MAAVFHTLLDLYAVLAPRYRIETDSEKLSEQKDGREGDVVQQIQARCEKNAAGE
jgi:hypothetical protein